MTEVIYLIQHLIEKSGLKPKDVSWIEYKETTFGWMPIVATPLVALEQMYLR